MLIDAPIPEKFAGLFDPARYKIYYGGRGSAKSHSFARALLVKATKTETRILCAREIQKSIQESVHKLLKDQIKGLGLNNYWDVKDRSITAINGSEFFFEGLYRNTTSIKSAEAIDICWVSEAHNVSADSWEDLIPTIRKERSEIWVDFNPKWETDETYQKFVVNTPPNSIVEKVNYYDNPWFPEVLRQEMEYDRSISESKYRHIWLGECKGLDSQVIDGNWFHIVEFKECKDAVRFWDLAVSIKTYADYSSGAKLSIDDRNDTIIHDIKRVKMEYPDLRELIIKQAHADGRETIIGVEEAGQQLGFIQDLQREPRLNGFQIKPLRPRGDKLNRAMPWASKAEAGKVFLVKGPWNRAFQEECSKFTANDTHQNDDQIDSVSGAFELLSNTSKYHIFRGKL